MIKVLIIEDSRLARLELKALLAGYPILDVFGEADTVKHAIELINTSNPDLIFLDIHLPGGSGFDVLSNLKIVPMVIFTTAFDMYALESFEHNTIDYLPKPIIPEKLNRAIHKVEIFRKKHEDFISEKKLDASDKIFIKDRNLSWLIEVSEIKMFESKGNYTQVFFNGYRPLIQKSLQQIFDSLQDGLFLRANRKQIVNIEWIAKIIKNPDGKLILKLSSGEEVLVSRRQMSKIKSLYSL